MPAIYRIYNGPTPTTAAQQKITTGTVIKTLLQLSPKTGIDLEVPAWGISFDGSAAATPGQVELIETDVAATVTASVTGDIVKVTNPGGPAADTGLITLGTANTGYTATVEGSTTVARVIDAQLVAPTNQYIYQWPFGTWPKLQAAKFGRVRVTFGSAILATCWIDFTAA